MAIYLFLLCHELIAIDYKPFALSNPSHREFFPLLSLNVPPIGCSLTLSPARAFCSKYARRPRAQRPESGQFGV